MRITSYADFEREFGGLDAASEASYAIQQFFLNGGTEAYVVRVGTAPIQDGLPCLMPGDPAEMRVFAGRRIRGAPVEDPGTWGNFLRLEVDYDTLTLPNTSLDPDGILTQGELFNLTISEVELRDGRTFVRQTETFRNLTVRPGARNNAIAVINEGSKLVQLERTGAAAIPLPPARPAVTGTVSDTLPSPPLVPPNTPETRPDRRSPGAAGPLPAINRTLTLNYGGAAPRSRLRLRTPVPRSGHSRQLSPTTRCSRAPRSRWPAGASTSTWAAAERLQSGGDGQLRRSRLLTQRLRSGMLKERTGAGQPSSVRSRMSLTGDGADSGALTEPALRGVRANKTGLFALEDADLFNILCVPAAAELGANDMRAFYTAAEAYCEERRSFLIIDIPEATDDLDAMQTWLTQNTNLRHRNAAAYFPRLRIADPLQQNRLEGRGPSGTMAGLYAATDAARGVKIFPRSGPP